MSFNSLPHHLSDARTFEVNFDGMVGPTHNYAGLAHGNLASEKHRGLISRPRLAALQGLEKAWKLACLGVPQAILLPHRRPHIPFLQDCGFKGTVSEIIQRCAREAPRLLAAAFSSSFMWTANAATVTPSLDCSNRRIHFTPANLQSSLHRAIESDSTTKQLKRIFAGERFVVHSPLQSTRHMSDEGAANHTRLCKDFESPGLHLFCYGDASDQNEKTTERFLPRQTRLAFETIARRHEIPAKQTIFVKQSAQAIDAGVFHNDVISVGHGTVLLVHDDAYEDLDRFLDSTRNVAKQACGFEPEVHVIPRESLSLAEAVSTYLFNSQIVTVSDGTYSLICPTEVRENPNSLKVAESIVRSSKQISRVEFLDVRQSMSNGGGPACLRLRVVMTQKERADVLPFAWLTEERYEMLTRFVNENYREELSLEDLAEPKFAAESLAISDRLLANIEL